ETYDRAPADLLDIQDDLSQRIVEALAVALASDAGVHVVDPGTNNAVAYDYFLQGRFFWNKRTPEDLDVAVGLFHKAIAEDSTFAAAYAGIADARAVPAGWDEDPAPALDTAEAYALRALEIDPTLSQAYASLGLTLMMRDLDFERAEASFLRAIVLDPTYATAHQWYAELLSATERHDEAVDEGRRAMELDPTMIIRWNLTRTLYNAGRYEEAIEVSEALMADGRTSFRPAPVYWLQSLAMLGRYEEVIDVAADAGMPPPLVQMARDSLEALGAAEFPAFVARRQEEGLATAESSPESSGVESGRGLLMLASAWARVDRDRALDYLKRIADDPNSAASRVDWFEVQLDPVFDDLRDDPRYRAVMQRFGLAF
ncbi:MAG: hypothetical protein ACWGON_00195, partial [Gemmatimonadota bacterium]